MAKSRLDQLSREMPSGEEFSQLIASLDEMDSRAAALIATSMLDGLLERCIICNFVQMHMEMSNRIFRSPQSPMGSFSAKIMLSFSIGIICEEQRVCMDRLRSIRNAFAHSVKSIDFSTPEIKSECMRLNVQSLIKNSEYRSEKDDARERFVVSALICGTHLIDYIQSKLTLVRSGVPVLPTPFRGRYG